MDIQAVIDQGKTAQVPIEQLRALAGNPQAFGADLIETFSAQAERRAVAAGAVLELAEKENRDLLASEQRSYDRSMKDADQIRALQATVEARTAQRATVPLSQQQTSTSDVKPASPVLGTENRCLTWLQQRGKFAYQQDQGAAAMRLGNFVVAMATGNRSHLSELEKRALSEGTDSTGGFTVPEIVASQFIDRTRDTAVVMKAGAQTVPMTSDTLHMARLATGLTPAPAWKLENDPITESMLTLERVTFTAHTLPILVKMSVELFEDSTNISEIVEREMSTYTANELDRVALVGSGTAPEPRGIANTAGVFTGTLPVTPTNYDWLIDEAAKLWGANEDPNAFISATALAVTLAKLKATDSGQPLLKPSALDGIRLFRTSAAGAKAFLGDFTQLMIGMRTSFRVEVSRVAGDAFTNLQVWVRSYIRADVQVARPKAFDVLS